MHSKPRTKETYKSGHLLCLGTFRIVMEFHAVLPEKFPLLNSQLMLEGMVYPRGCVVSLRLFSSLISIPFKCILMGRPGRYTQVWCSEVLHMSSLQLNVTVVGFHNEKNVFNLLSRFHPIQICLSSAYRDENSKQLNCY